MKRLTLLFLAAAAVAIILPAASSATEPNNESNSYTFLMEVPNSAQDSAGDTLSVEGEGMFSVHPKSASGGGTYHFTPVGGTPFSGTWTVNGLVAFQPYGCGIVHFPTGDVILPPNFCGGQVILDVTATTPS